MSPVYKNIAANYLGNIITAILAFLFMPVYVHYLGISAYGIIGFFATLQVLFSFLDIGIGMAINREMARHYYNIEKANYLRIFTHTLQVVYWGIGILIGLILLLGSPYLSVNWFRETTVPGDVLLVAFLILSLTIAFRWPYSLYASGLRGMQHQVALNIHDLSWSLVKTIGSWIVLKYIDNTLLAFLWFQFAVTLLQTVGVMLMLWHFMPKAPQKNKVVFSKEMLKGISRYAAGMGITAILSTLLLQMDKVIVSKMVSDAQFGYYTIATNVSILVYNVSLPMYMAILPHFTKLFYENRLEEVQKDFHFYARLLSCLLLPFSMVIFVYSREFLWLWTKNNELADAISPLLKLMIAGTTIIAMMMPVHTLTLAKSKLRLMLYSNLIFFILAIPVIVWLTTRLGTRGGAASMLVLAGGFFIVQAPFIFFSLQLKKSLAAWYFKDILFFAAPLLTISILLMPFREYIVSLGRFEMFLALALITILYYSITFLLNRQLVSVVRNRLRVMMAGNK